jgi:hypothetical protein
LCIQHFVVDLHQETKQKQNVMNNAQINTIAENKEFIAACANFAKECGITRQKPIGMQTKDISSESNSRNGKGSRIRILNQTGRLRAAFNHSTK